MMDKDTARKLLPLVNNEEAMDGLNAWVDIRIEALREELENLSITDSRPAQGGIRELRLLQKDFRQRVLDKVK